MARNPAPPGWANEMSTALAPLRGAKNAESAAGSYISLDSWGVTLKLVRHANFQIRSMRCPPPRDG
jgi:hypothetical protein